MCTFITATVLLLDMPLDVQLHRMECFITTDFCLDPSLMQDIILLKRLVLNIGKYSQRT